MSAIAGLDQTRPSCASSSPSPSPGSRCSNMTRAPPSTVLPVRRVLRRRRSFRRLRSLPNQPLNCPCPPAAAAYGRLIYLSSFEARRISRGFDPVAGFPLVLFVSLWFGISDVFPTHERFSTGVKNQEGCLLRRIVVRSSRYVCMTQKECTCRGMRLKESG